MQFNLLNFVIILFLAFKTAIELTKQRPDQLENQLKKWIFLIFLMNMDELSLIYDIIPFGRLYALVAKISIFYSRSNIHELFYNLVISKVDFNAIQDHSNQLKQPLLTNLLKLSLISSQFFCERISESSKGKNKILLNIDENIQILSGKQNQLKIDAKQQDKQVSSLVKSAPKNQFQSAFKKIQAKVLIKHAQDQAPAVYEDFELIFQEDKRKIILIHVNDAQEIYSQNHLSDIIVVSQISLMVQLVHNNMSKTIIKLDSKQQIKDWVEPIQQFLNS